MYTDFTYLSAHARARNDASNFLSLDTSRSILSKKLKGGDSAADSGHEPFSRRPRSEKISSRDSLCNCARAQLCIHPLSITRLKSTRFSLPLSLSLSRCAIVGGTVAYAAPHDESKRERLGTNENEQERRIANESERERSERERKRGRVDNFQPPRRNGRTIRYCKTSFVLCRNLRHTVLNTVAALIYYQSIFDQ